MKKSIRLLSIVLAGVMLLSTSALACTGVYVGKDVSDQGTYIIARSEDQGQSDYNKMFLVQPHVDNVPGRYIEDTATGFRIPLPATTYQYTYVPDYTRGDDGMYPGSCTNEYGVSVTGTVSTSTCDAWRSADPFIEPGLREAILAAAVAAVSKTAREAVDVLLGYVDEYGSEEGNTVMINDQNEAWYIEIYSGHHYCAMKMPDDKVAVYGNQNMIGLVDPNATAEDGYIYSDGLFDLIDELGLAVKEGELYHLAKSVTNNTRRDSSNMRNWGGMKLLAPSQAGEYDTDTFYPLFYSPDEKVSVLDVMDIYRNRYEGTELDVTLEGSYWWSFGLTSDLILLRGFEQVLLDMYDNPDGLHRLMAFLRDEALTKLDFLENSGLLSRNDTGDFIGTGGYGYTNRLPQPGFDPAHVTTMDMWGFSESQESVGVSPELFAEFIFPYQNAILQRFGRNIYGCCEPLDKRWDTVREIPRLARVTVSPWSDPFCMAEKLGRDYVYVRKINPSYMATPVLSEEDARRELRETFTAAYRYGCPAEVLLRDVVTLSWNPYNAIRWTELAREEIENVCK